MPTYWTNRRLTAEAACRIALARALVRFVPLGRWRDTLGTSIGLPAVAETGSEPHRTALSCARAVGRAAARLPGTSKCLPQAMALQWMLARRDISSLLVIAVVKDRTHADGDEYHAWVEQGGRMIIGESERSAYQPIIRVLQGGGTGD